MIEKDEGPFLSALCNGWKKSNNLISVDLGRPRQICRRLLVAADPVRVPQSSS